MYQKPKGTRDYFPEDRAVFNWMSGSLRDTAKRYGYKEVEGPAFETMEILTAKQGDEINKQIFTLEGKGDGKDKEEFGLRFDLTVPMARMFVERQKELPKPVKWFGISRMWRYERPQAGRLREFYQLSVECFGSDKPAADAEMIAMAIDCLFILGMTKKDFVVRLNNRVLLQDFIESIGSKNIEGVFRAIDKKSKITPEAFDEELKKSGLDASQMKKIREFIAIKDLSRIKVKSAGLDSLRQVISLLESRKEFIEVDLSTARGLSYYTGTVFEIFDRQGKLRSIAGGGRYDNLVQLFGGEKCPATGFAIGFATLGLLLEEKKLLPETGSGVDYYIAPIDEKSARAAIYIADLLRKEGSVEIDIMGRSLGKQLEYANKTGAKNLVVVGEDEVKKKIIKIKNMKSGKETELSVLKL